VVGRNLRLEREDPSIAGQRRVRADNWAEGDISLADGGNFQVFSFGFGACGLMAGCMRPYLFWERCARWGVPGMGDANRTSYHGYMLGSHLI